MADAVSSSHAAVKPIAEVAAKLYEYATAYTHGKASWANGDICSLIL
jgi:hypothetical protein